jgi:hypothetical protein
MHQSNYLPQRQHWRSICPQLYEALQQPNKLGIIFGTSHPNTDHGTAEHAELIVIRQ